VPRNGGLPHENSTDIINQNLYHCKEIRFGLIKGDKADGDEAEDETDEDVCRKHGAARRENYMERPWKQS
jgi:hypothetical protein